MSTYTLKLSVTSQGGLEIENRDDKYIEAVFGLQEQPSVLYKENTISLGTSVKAINLKKEVNDDEPVSLLPQPVNRYNQYGNVYVIDVVSADDSLYYIFAEYAVTSGTYAQYYLAPVLGDEYFKLTQRLTFSGNDSIVGKRWAEVQNSLYFLKDEKTDTFEDHFTDNYPNIGTPGNNQLVKLLSAIQYEYIDLTGLDLYDPDGTGNSISGIIGSGNYLIVWNKYRIWWSSPLDVSNFDPSGASGAGNALITDAKGVIVTVEPTLDGFLVFCRDNIVSARYSGDSENPWIFKEVIDGGGLIVSGNNFLVSGEKNKGTYVAYTSKGLQLVEPNRARTLPSAINQVISGNVTEVKVDNLGQLQKEVLTCNTGCSISGIKNIHFEQGLLFIYFAATAPNSNNIDYSKLIIYNLDTNAVDYLKGDFPVVVPRRNPRSTASGVYQEVSVAMMPLHFTLVSRAYDPTHVVDNNEIYYRLAARVLNLTSSDSTTLLEDDPNYVAYDAQFPNDPATLLFELGLNPDTEVEIHSIKLVGDKGNTPDTRPVVKVYSAIYGWDTPQEFVYHASTDTYYGYACGKNPRIEVQGRVFNLSSIDVEVSKGAS